MAMIRIMLQKLLHKKWMVISLLIGNILLIAIAVSHPMYKDASLQRMLTDEFTSYLKENNENPALLSIVGRVRKSDGFADYQKMKELSETICGELGLTEQLRAVHNNLITSTAVSAMDRDDAGTEKKLMIGSMSDLAEHSQVISGRMYSDSPAEDGCIEAVVTMSGFVNMNVLVGEELDFLYLSDADGNQIRIRITGVINNVSSSDEYWVESPDSFDKELLISPVLFDSLFQNGGKRFEYNTRWYIMFDYEMISFRQAAVLAEKTEALSAEQEIYGKLEEPAYLELLERFLANEKKVEVTLAILQVPVLVLLCAFLFMISRQMLEMEQSEISILKSRGAGKGQIFRLYLMQSAFLALISLAAGLPLGSFICRALGSSNAFLEFVQRRPLQIHYTGEVFVYALAAALVSVLMTILPAMKQSGISIVRQKQSRARRKKPLWQKLYLDVIILGVSLYGYYSFHRQQETLVSAVLTGEALDPLLFFSSSLFILGAALFCLRLQPLLVRLIYMIGKKRWKPAAYASFLEILRTGSRQYFIMTFLMLTVALGIFNTTVARTILANAEENLVYHTGADLVIQEVWPSNELQVKLDPTVPLVYTEPDYGKYGQIAGVNSMTKVYINEDVQFKKGSEKGAAVLYGIHTKTFGETTSLPDGLMEKHYYDYLNELAVNSDGVLLSASFRDKLGYSVGDTISYMDASGNAISAVICDFIDYFPSYQPEYSGLNPDGTAYIADCYLIVAHLSTIQKNWGITPYEIWFDVDSASGFYDFIEANYISLSKCVDTASELIDIKNDTLFQGTNGILTMSFIVILLLCGAGYLIYWILSIRSRELLFGIFRAMGMSRGEIIKMLLNEQIFSSLLSIGCGTVIGFAASRLFVPMIQIAYSAADQVLPMKLLTQESDMARLFGIIFVVFVICLMILARQIFRMKITQALKLGED